MNRHTMGLLAAGAAAAVVLGAASTAGLAAIGAFPGSGTPTTPAECEAPALPGTLVRVTLTDMGTMMGRPHGPGPTGNDNGHQWWPHMGMGMTRLYATPDAVPQGTVSLQATNTGAWPHEVMVMPLPAGQDIGERPVGANGKIDETGSLGEASRTCGAGTGHPMGIAPGATGWTTLTLRPGRYELICNLPGHYAAGMYTALDVTAG